VKKGKVNRRKKRKNVKNRERGGEGETRENKE